MKRYVIGCLLLSWWIASCDLSDSVTSDAPTEEIHCDVDLDRWDPNFRESLAWKNLPEFQSLDTEILNFLERWDTQYYAPMGVAEQQLDSIIHLLDSVSNPTYLLLHAKALRLKANQHSIRGAYSLATALAQQAADLYLNKSAETAMSVLDSIELADVYNVISTTSQNDRDIGRSIQASLAAMEIYCRYRLYRDVANEYTNIATALSFGAEPDSANTILQKSIDLWDQLWAKLEYPSDNDFFNRLGTTFNLGNNLFVQGDKAADQSQWERADQLYDRAIANFRKVKDELGAIEPQEVQPFYLSTLSIANVHNRKAEINPDQPDSTLFYATIAEDTLTKVLQAPLDQMPPAISARLILLKGTYHARLGELNQALAYHLQGLRLIVPGTTDPSDLESVDFANIGDKVLYLQALYSLADSYVALYRRSEDVDLLRKALDNYENAIRFLRLIRVDFADDTSVEAIANRLHGLYSRAARVAYQLHKLSPDSANYYLERSLQIADAGKSFTLRTAANRSLTALNAPEELGPIIQQDIALRQRINETAQAGNFEALELVQREYNTFINGLASSRNPQLRGYYLSRFDQPTISLEQMQEQWIDDKSAIVEYELGRGKGLVYVITKEDIEVIPLELDSTLFDLMENYRKDLVATKTDTDFGRHSFALYRQIFEVVDNRLKAKNIVNFLVVPDRELSTILFSALLTEQAELPSEWKEATFALDKYAISYAFSLGSYDAMRQLNTFQNENVNLLATYIANPTTSNSNLPKLTCSTGSLDKMETASNEISESFATQSVFNPATETAFKQSAKDHRILQVTAHGCFEIARDPLDNSIQLYASDEDDGQLTVAEITYLPLINTQLTVLSNCDSGRGVADTGEGLKSMARAFTYAGSECIIASMREVGVPVTAAFLMEFYPMLEKGIPTYQATAEAKRALKAKGRSPADWSGYIHIGDLNQSFSSLTLRDSF